MKKIVISIVSLVLSSTSLVAQESSVEPKSLSEYKSSAELVQALPESAWRSLSSENTIVMELESGNVIIELASEFAPKHVENIKTLVSENYFDGTAVIRSQDNYVAQWGDTTDVSVEGAEPKSIGSAEANVEVEFFRSPKEISFNKIESRDAYADSVGFTAGMPTASDGTKAWLAHCYGMVGVSRGMGTDSGNGSGLYAVTGHSPRHLDLNVTLVGKVWRGIEHLSSLPRGTGPLGFFEDPSQYVSIKSVRFLEEDEAFKVMRTDTPEFNRFVELRTTRNEDWFIEPTGKIELCNVWVPTQQ